MLWRSCMASLSPQFALMKGMILGVVSFTARNFPQNTSCAG